MSHILQLFFLTLHKSQLMSSHQIVMDCRMMFKCQGHCSELWGMGAEGFRRAPMMHQKVPTLGRTNYTIDETRRINGKEEIDTKALLGTTST